MAGCGSMHRRDWATDDLSEGARRELDLLRIHSFLQPPAQRSLRSRMTLTGNKLCLKGVCL
jgi:hypothetical protein